MNPMNQRGRNALAFALTLTIILALMVLPVTCAAISVGTAIQHRHQAAADLLTSAFPASDGDRNVQ